VPGRSPVAPRSARYPADGFATVCKISGKTAACRFPIAPSNLAGNSEQSRRTALTPGNIMGNMDIFDKATIHLTSNTACSRLLCRFVKLIGAPSLWREIDIIGHRPAPGDYGENVLRNRHKMNG
jgi:hypothetical protein